MSSPEVDARRRELESRLAQLRADLEGSIGWAPRAAWTVPLVGLAAGFSLAIWFGRRRAKARRRLPPRRRPSR
jgi:hypothetical protein